MSRRRIRAQAKVKPRRLTKRNIIRVNKSAHLVSTYPSRFKLANLLLFGGVIFVLFPFVYKNLYRISAKPRIDQASIAVAKITKQDISKEPIRVSSTLLEKRETTQPPLRIIIPQLNIDLSIIEAQIVQGQWELSETTASHGVGSANPGEIGNSVIFAHAREGLFLPLRSVQKDQLIYILTKDRWYRYRVSDIQFVDPNQIETIRQSNDEQLTLYTCSGFLDSKRLIVAAKPARP